MDIKIERNSESQYLREQEVVSVIVPTLWAVPTFPSRLVCLAKNPWVAEIIVIDNNPRSAPKIDHPKIKFLPQSRNIYVNPAWNLGAKFSKEEILCFLNDDLEFKPEIIEFTVNLFHNNPEIGLSGLDWPHPFGKINYKNLEKRISGFGCMMFVRKKDYVSIPGCLKIYYGDDFMFEIAKLKKRNIIAISGFADQWQEHSISTKIIYENIKKITIIDEIRWKRYIRRLLYLRYNPPKFFHFGIKRLLKIKFIIHRKR